MTCFPSRICVLTATLFLLAGGYALQAQTTSTTDVPRIFSYQGLLTSTDGKAYPDGQHQVTVNLYSDAQGTVKIWQDTYTTQVTGGVFNLYLGEGKPLPDLSSMSMPLWIGTSVNGAGEMRPLTPLSASPYALNVPDQAITTNKIVDGAITAEKLGVDFISAVQVDGEKISAKGTVLNLVGTPSVPLTYDEATQSVTIGQLPAQTGDIEKGASPLIGQRILWSVNGDGWTLPAGTGIGYTPVAGDWIGTIAPTAVNFLVKVNSVQIMRYQISTLAGAPNVQNIIGGDVGNAITAATSKGSIIAQGFGQSIANGVYQTISGGENNAIAGTNGHHNVIGGGATNTITESEYSTIGGGDLNKIGNAATGVHHSGIGSGWDNEVYGSEAVIAGGHNNTVHSYASGILVGHDNTIQTNSPFSAIGGGNNNIINANSNNSFIGGGQSNSVTATYATIGGGNANIMTGTNGFIGGGQNNNVSGNSAVIGGGDNNTASGSQAFIGAGDNNTASGPQAVVGGGQGNTAIAPIATVGGGGGNNVTAPEGTIAGGHINQVDDYVGTIAGGHNNWIQPGGNAGFVGGGRFNFVSAPSAAIGGGENNIVSGMQSFIGGGMNNTITGAPIATIGGGGGHVITGAEGTIAGGHINRVDAYVGTIAGGHNGLIAPAAMAGAIGGGRENTVNGTHATITGGDNNLTDPSYAQTIAGFFNANRGAAVPFRPSAAVIAGTDLPLFMVGNGDGSVAVPVRSNAFEVSYNGHSTVFDVNGPGAGGGRAAHRGATYTDNIIYAWACVDGDATIVDDFGVDNVSQVGPGTYVVTLNYLDPYSGANTFNGSICPVATIRDGNCGFISVSCGTGPGVNSFTITTMSPDCGLTDLPFTFHVTGRP